MKTETHTLPCVCWCSQQMCARAQDNKIDRIHAVTQKKLAICACTFDRNKVTIDRTVVLRSISKACSHAIAY